MSWWEKKYVIPLMIVPVTVIVLSYLQKKPTFNCRDVPNFLEKPVQLINLKTKSWNKKIGLVIEWNEEREKFGVQLVCDGSVKWVKPMNLMYYPLAENKKEKQLYTLIGTQKLIDFEKGLLRFEEIECKENYAHTYMKLFWICDFIHSLDMKDKRCLPKMQKVLENIIEVSTFDDLIVKAKILFFTCLMAQNSENQYDPHKLQLYMSCVKDHHGYLPELFYCIYTHTDLDSEMENRNIEMFQILKDIYVKSKNLIVNKLCAYGYHDDCHFLQGALGFLNFCKNNVSFPVFEKISEEVNILREILDQQMLDHNTENLNVKHNHIVAMICVLEENYEDALINIEQYQEDIGTSFGNHHHLGSMANSYFIKTKCYIKLGNKPMAKKALKKLKRFRNNFETIDDFIENSKEDIRKMTNQNSNVAREEKKNVRPRMQCSSYICKKVEPEVGAFKHCGKCRMQYYCSVDCQKHHWSNGHKAECKKF